MTLIRRSSAQTSGWQFDDVIMTIFQLHPALASLCIFTFATEKLEKKRQRGYLAYLTVIPTIIYCTVEQTRSW